MATDQISNGESMETVRAKLNATITAANRAGGPVDEFADLPASPVDFEAHYVRSLGYPVWWDAEDEAWKNSLGVEITDAEEG